MSGSLDSTRNDVFAKLSCRGRPVSESSVAERIYFRLAFHGRSTAYTVRCELPFPCSPGPPSAFRLVIISAAVRQGPTCDGVAETAARTSISARWSQPAMDSQSMVQHVHARHCDGNTTRWLMMGSQKCSPSDTRKWDKTDGRKVQRSRTWSIDWCPILVCMSAHGDAILSRESVRALKVMSCNRGRIVTRTSCQEVGKRKLERHLYVHPSCDFLQPSYKPLHLP